SNSAGSVTSSIVTVTVVPDSIFYLYEPFDYIVGQRLTNFTLGTGQAWTNNGSNPDTTIAPGNLTVPGLVPSVGQSITNGGSGAAARLPIGGSQNFGAIYASFA